jgi:hypothetical protein
MRVCKSCGAQQNDEARFCGKCGHALANEPRLDRPPEAVSPLPAPAPALTPTPTPAGVQITPRAVLSLMGGIGIIAAAFIDWSRGGSANSFKVPAGILFDWKSQSENPKLGYFLVGFGVLCIVVAFVRANGFVLVTCGLLSLAASGLYSVQLYRFGHAFGGHVNVTDLVGPGAWVLGIAGVVLTLSPLVAPRVRTPSI